MDRFHLKGSASREPSIRWILWKSAVSVGERKRTSTGTCSPPGRKVHFSIGENKEDQQPADM